MSQKCTDVSDLSPKPWQTKLPAWLVSASFLTSRRSNKASFCLFVCLFLIKDIVNRAKYLWLNIYIYFRYISFFILPSLDFSIKFTSHPLLFLPAESSSEIRVGIDELMSITVLLENSEENSYNTHVILTYPAGLSYRKLTILQVSHLGWGCAEGIPQGFLVIEPCLISVCFVHLI